MSHGPPAWETVYEPLGFPERSRLDKRIFKRQVLENCQPTPADKRVLSVDVDALTWKYTLKASTIQVSPYEDRQREYLEVAVIEMVLKRRQPAGRLAELLHRAIPYPVLLVMRDDSGLCVSVAHKRVNESKRVVAEAHQNTPWLELPLSVLDREFTRALSLGSLSQVDFYALYCGMVDAVVARSCAELTGRFVIDPQIAAADRRAQLGRCRQMERELAGLRSQIRGRNGCQTGELSFAAKVELNARIKNLEATLTLAKSAL